MSVQPHRGGSGCWPRPIPLPGAGGSLLPMPAPGGGLADGGPAGGGGEEGRGSGVWMSVLMRLESARSLSITSHCCRFASANRSCRQGRQQ
jgi:hypothetical protein